MKRGSVDWSDWMDSELRRLAPTLPAEAIAKRLGIRRHHVLIRRRDLGLVPVPRWMIAREVGIRMRGLPQEWRKLRPPGITAPHYTDNWFLQNERSFVAGMRALCPELEVPIRRRIHDAA